MMHRASPSASRLGFVLLALVLTLGTTGCVTRSTYDSVVAERAELREQKERLEVRNRALQTRIRNVNQDVLVLGERIQQKDQALAEAQADYDELIEELEVELAAGLVAVSLMRNGVNVMISEEILFPSGSAKVSERGAGVLSRVAAQLKEIPYQIVVGGFTDNVPIGPVLARTFPTNWDLAGARAARVTALMQQAGVPPEQLIAVSFGENQPVASNATEEGRARNRRIELRIRPIVSGQGSADM